MGPPEIPLALAASPQHIFSGILEGTTHENRVRDLMRRQDPEQILRYCALISLYLWNHSADEAELRNLIKEGKHGPVENNIDHDNNGSDWRNH